MYEKIEVLNGQGYIALVDAMGNDKSILDAARVSYNRDTISDQQNEALTEKDEKLLRYLLTNRHTSPFEHVQLKFEVSAPIFVFRQWHRHRTWSYNEISARYTELPEKFYVPTPDDIGVQHSSNKQMRETVALDQSSRIERKIQIDQYEIACKQSFLVYKDLIEAGWPRELARAVLPVSTFSRMAATVDLHNLMSFLRLRLHAHAQKEIQVYAVAILHLMRQIVPLTTAIFLGTLEGQKGYEHIDTGKTKVILS
jgi:thymidylate synthase (FAD)